MAADFQNPLCHTLSPLHWTHFKLTQSFILSVISGQRAACSQRAGPCVCRFTWSVMLKQPVQSSAPCSSSPAGSVQCRAPALTPRAAYGKAIRASVPLKRGTERNTTALNTMPRLPFPPASSFFFFSSSKKIPARPRFTLCFFNLFPLLLAA